MGCGSSTSDPKSSQQSTNSTGPQHFSEFPTPRKLEEAQRNFFKNRQTTNPGTDKKTKIPLPSPANTNNFNVSDHVGLDTYATEAPASLARAPLEEVVKYFSTHSNDAISKARMFYVWIGAQDLLTHDWHGVIPPGCALYYLSLHYNGVNNLNELFVKLCSLANIPCKIIHGAVKGRGHRVGCLPVRGHSWCAVHIDGSWRLVDQECGSKYFREPLSENDETPPPKLTKTSLYLYTPQTHQTPSKRTRRTVKNKPSITHGPKHAKKTTSQQGRSDSYFLASPQQFVFDHLADEPGWQLLARAVTSEEFKKMASIKQGFFDASFVDTSAPQCVIHAVEGQVDLELDVATNKAARMCYSLRMLEGSSKQTDQIKGSLNEYVYLESQGNTKKIHVSLKEIGLYRLDLFAFNNPLQADVVKAKADLIAEYIVVCDRPAFKCIPNPRNPRFEFGPGAEMIELGIKDISHHSGTIEAAEGPVIVRFQCDIYSLQFTHVLESQDFKSDSLSSMSRHYLDDEHGEVVFAVLLPKQGRYLFKIYCRQKETSFNGAFFNICNFLIVATESSKNSRSFPAAHLGQIGQLSLVPDSIIRPISHPCPIVFDTQSHVLHISMQSAFEDVDLSVQLDFFADETGTSEDMSEYAWYRIIPQVSRVEVDVRFPRPGAYCLTLYGTKVGCNDLKVEDFYKYVMMVDRPHAGCFPFPSRHVAWKPEFLLKQPEYRYLPSNAKVYFDLRVPEAEEVGVLTHSWSTIPLKRKIQSTNASVIDGGIDEVYDSSVSTRDEHDEATEEGWWEGEVETGAGGSSITIVARFVAMSQFTYLLDYQVLNDKDMKIWKIQQTDAEDEAVVLREGREVEKQKELQLRHNEQQEEQNRVLQWKADYNNKSEQIKSDLTQYWKEYEDSWLVFVEEEETRLRESERELTPEEERRIVNETAEKLRRRSVNHEAGFYSHKYHGTKNSLQRENMRLATRNKDSFEQHLTERGGDLSAAKRTMSVQDAREELDRARDKIDREGIKNSLAYIHSMGLREHMRQDVQDAEVLLTQLEKTNDLKSSLLNMDRTTMSEVRGYSRPPDVVRDVIVATLLMVGEDEHVTKDWVTCQKLCATVGQEGLSRRIEELHVAYLHPEIVARIRQILSPLEFHKVQSVSNGAAAFYIWLQGTLDSWEKSSGGRAAMKVLPATISRQRQIFGRRPLEDERNKQPGKLGRP